MKLLLVLSIVLVTLSFGKFAVRSNNTYSTLEKDTITIYVKQILENLRQKMPTGVPELDIPPLEPLKLGPIVENINEGVAKLSLKFNGLEVKGLSTFNLKDIKLDLGTLSLFIRLCIPEASAKSLYDLKGTIADIVPLYGNGNAKLIVNDLDVSLNAALDFSSGKLQLKSMKVNMMFTTINLFLENLLGGGSLGEVVNTVINMVGKKLFDNHKSEIESALQKIILKAGNQELAKLNIDAGGFGYSAVGGSDDYIEAGNDYFDDLMKGLRPFLMTLDPMKIPEVRDGFEKKLGVLTFKGYAQLTDGTFRGLSTLHRTSNADMTINETSGQIDISIGLGINHAVANFNGELYFLGIRIRPGLTATIEGVQVKMSASFNTVTGYKKLHEFRITKIEKPRVKVTHLSIFGSFLSFMTNLVIQPITNHLRGTLSTTVKAELDKMIENVKLPF